MPDGFNERSGFSKHTHPIDHLAEANGLLSGIALYPQLFKVITTGETRALAPTTYLIFFVANIVWIIYGIHRRALPVLISSALNLIASGALLGLFLFWRK
jgi:uncharacterized protein with PQ loop repeat